jgi:uncharacterized membrane protein
MSGVTGLPDVDPGAERAIGRMLAGGTLVVVGLVGVGSFVLLATGRGPSSAAPGPGLDLGRLPGDLLAVRPEGLLWLGLCLTIALPTVRVVAALVAFRRAGDTRYERIATGVLLTMAVALGVALAVGGHD